MAHRHHHQGVHQWHPVDRQGRNDGVLATSNRRPDILITRPWPEPPVVIENEYNIANVEGDCLNKLGQGLQPSLGAQTIHTVIGVHSPKDLQNAANGDDAETMLRDGATLQYAVYSGTPDDHTRFPESGFITGDVRNLVEFVRPAAEPTDMISQAADDLADGADRAANAIVDAAALDTKVGVNIAEKLRQPWPKGKSENPQQAKADQEARRQTANMATTMIINALAYQQNLDGYNGIRGLAQIRNATPATVSPRMRHHGLRRDPRHQLLAHLPRCERAALTDSGQHRQQHAGGHGKYRRRNH